MNTGARNVIVGFGKTGRSVAAHCVRNSLPFAIADDALTPDGIADYDEKPLLASIKAFPFEGQDRLIVSPGVPLRHPALQNARALGAEFTNDIQIFAEISDQPLALITGSNGKSTVTHFVGQLMQFAGKRNGVGGNIGTPALDLLETPYDFHVLEVSSYQLELATHCNARVAALLNLSPDHLDRYASVDEYYQTKTHVFSGCQTAIINRATRYAFEFEPDVKVISFGADQPPTSADYGLDVQNGVTCLMRGSEMIAETSALTVPGRHNWLNLLAAFAISEALGVTRSELQSGLSRVTGLAHRCEPVDEIVGMTVINDSKSTNPASTLTAIDSFAESTQSMTLILGGQGKDADFSVLKPVLNKHVDRCYVYGKDREMIAATAGFPVTAFETLDECLTDIKSHVDTDLAHLLLFSPGCASLDQFENFEDRGRYFKAAVREVFK